MCSTIGVFFSPAWVPSESTQHVDEGKAICLPRRRLGQMLRPLTLGSWQKGRGRGCNQAGEVCARRLFFFFFVSCCTWKSTWGVHATQCVCEMTTERYLVFKRLGFLEQQTTVSSFFSQYSFRRAMLQLEFRESKSKPEESHFEQSQRHRRYAVCSVGGDDVWTLTTHETRLSSRFTLAYFSSKVLSETSNAPT